MGEYDVLVVGAGVVGSAIARELAGARLRVGLVEARSDVGAGTSKANTAILHTGFDAVPGTLESRLVARGHRLFRAYAEAVGIPIEDTGAILVAWTPEELAALPSLAAKARANRYPAVRELDADQVREAEPQLGEGVLGGLLVPDEAITCTWTATLALATEAALRGVAILRNARVERVEVGAEATVVNTSAGTLKTSWLINAAGLGGDELDHEMGGARFALTPRRGQLMVFDKLARPLLNHIVLPVPTALGKGVLVSPTIYGNVMVGPTAEDLADRSATETTAEGLAFLQGKAARLVPALAQEEVTATYAGLRAASDQTDFVIEVDPVKRYAVAGGIRSTGLTAALAIAEHLGELLAGAGLSLEARDDLPAPPRMPNLGEGSLRPYRDATRIAADPAYGTVVCFCERVTQGEVRDALTSTIAPVDLDGLRRRTRAGNGRCQGFYCGARVEELLQSATESPR